MAASDFETAVSQTITASNQFHDVINGSTTDTITTDSGEIPSLRKSLIDNFYFLDPLPWADGVNEEVFNQIRDFEGLYYYAPTATTGNPVPMGATPVGDDNWKLSAFNSNVKEIIPQELPKYTDIVYKASGGNSAVENMISQASIGDTCLTGGTLWERIIFSSPPSIDDFKSIGFTSSLDANQNQEGIQEYAKAVTSRNDIPKTVTSARIVTYGTLDGEDLLRLSLEGADDATLGTDPNDISVKKNIRVRNTRLSGPTSQPSNNNAVLTIARSDGAIVTNNEVEQAYSSFTLEYGNLPPAGEERRPVNSIVGQNVVRGHYMGYEMFTSAFNALVGNVASSKNPDGGIQHGLRITGYGKNHLDQGHDLRNRGNAYVGNVFHNYANGISQQTGAYGNVTVSAITDALNGILFTENTTLDDAISESNCHIFAIDKVERGSYLYDPKASMFFGTVRDASDVGWVTDSGARDATSNTYDLNITQCKDAARFEDNNSYIKVVASDMQEGGVIVTGNYNIVDLVIDDINISGVNDSALNVSGSGNIIRFNGYALRQPFSEVIISGDQNHLDFNGNYTLPQGQVAVTGSNNIIRGHCHITSSSGSNNDYSGVVGWSKTGTVTVTTSAAGVASLGIAGGMPDNISGYEFTASSTEFTNPHLVVRKGSGDQVLILAAQTGAIISSTSVTLRYSYSCYK